VGRFLRHIGHKKAASPPHMDGSVMFSRLPPTNTRFLGPTRVLNWCHRCACNIQNVRLSQFQAVHQHTSRAFYYFARESGGEVLWWARLSVCLSVCASVCQSVCEHIYGATSAIFAKFLAHVAYGRGSVLLRQGDEIPRRRGNLGDFSTHWQCIVTRSLQMGSTGKGLMGVHNASEV